MRFGRGPRLEGLAGRPALHLAATVAPTGVVGLKIAVQLLLHLLDASRTRSSGP